MMTAMEQMGVRAKEASRALAVAGAAKDEALAAIAEALVANCDKILEANRLDLEQGEKNGLSKAMLDRLALNPQRVQGMADGMLQVKALPDPIGKVLEGGVRPNGLHITKVRVPLGVIGIIYEARPNVTADAAALCLKSGNAVILRGGKEAIHSNTCIAQVMRQALEGSKVPVDSIQLVTDTTRQSSIDLMNLTEYLDVLIPRGGAGLIRAVVEQIGRAHV